MYARSVSIRVRRDNVAEFTRLVETESLPMLRKQAGFQDAITFVLEGGGDALSISFWDRKESADAYGLNGYPEVLKTLSKVIEGTPLVHSYQVSNSTCHNIAALAFST